MRFPSVVLGSWFVIVGLCGCGPIMRELQFTNPRTALFPMHMDLRVGQGKLDARELMAARTYEGVVERPGVSVHYPAGMSALAEDVASAFEAAEIEVRSRTGVTWAFRPILYLVPVGDTSGGFRLRIPLRKTRELHLPMLVRPGREPAVLPEWSRGIGHEITEASMLASLDRRELILGDYCLWGAGLVNETRWFREGVSEYAGDILNKHLFGDRYQPPSRIYLDLSHAGEDLLRWDNCTHGIGPQAYYNASLGLIRELTNRFGEDVIARIMEAASEDRYIRGSTLRRAVKRVTGLDLSEFLRGYRTVWLGMDLADTRLISGSRYLTGEGNTVRVVRIYPGTPAEKWKLRPGDVILSADGHRVTSAAWLVHYISAMKPRDRVQVEFERAGERFTHNMVLATP